MSARDGQGPPDKMRSDYRSVTDIACDHLRGAIVDGDFEPGQQLKERELADLLGVSTTPVKAALQRLALEGLITSVPLRGSFVAENVRSILAEVGLIRAALEGTAAFLAAKKATEEELKELRDQTETMRARTATRDVRGAVEANARFHEIIHSISRNHTLQQMIGIVRHYNDILRPRLLADEDQMLAGLSEHMAVFEAIAGGDGELADRRMREHVLRSTRHVESGALEPEAVESASAG